MIAYWLPKPTPGIWRWRVTDASGASIAAGCAPELDQAIEDARLADRLHRRATIGEVATEILRDAKKKLGRA